MYGSSIDFAEVRFFSFDDEISIYRDILLKTVCSSTRLGFSIQMFKLAAFFPFSILSDTGTIWFEYRTQNKPIEFKSLKYYLNSFQNVEIFQEYVKSWIYNGLNMLLDTE